MRTLLFGIIGLIFLGASACAPVRGKGKAAPSRADGAAVPRIELPELAAPVPLPAKRVLNLFYSSNVMGDAEPCG